MNTRKMSFMSVLLFRRRDVWTSGSLEKIAAALTGYRLTNRRRKTERASN
jgi:hypothetical protein